MPRSRLTIRPAGPEDTAGLVDLGVAALGWAPEDPNLEFFEWKHVHNPFGPSFVWVAEVAGRLAGMRILMRWDFRRLDGTVAHAVRAVDTATHPEFQGQGVFSSLTRHAVDRLREEGVAFVFNTPNDQSRPGYLKMGWEVVGRVPTWVRPSGPTGVARMVRARTPAAKWSVTVDAGTDPAEAFADTAVLESLFASRSAVAGLATVMTPDFLRWRYGFAPLAYRVSPVGRDIRDGFVVHRVRRRGRALELVVADVIVPAGSRTAIPRATRRAAAADYALAAGPRRPAGFVPLPRQGPVLTWRSLGDATRPGIDGWQLGLGDVELF